jgi:hypothetical protein
MLGVQTAENLDQVGKGLDLVRNILGPFLVFLDIPILVELGAAS